MGPRAGSGRGTLVVAGGHGATCPAPCPAGRWVLPAWGTWSLRGCPGASEATGNPDLVLSFPLLWSCPSAPETHLWTPLPGHPQPSLAPPLPPPRPRGSPLPHKKTPSPACPAHCRLPARVPGPGSPSPRYWSCLSGSPTRGSDFRSLLRRAPAPRWGRLGARRSLWARSPSCWTMGEWQPERVCGPTRERRGGGGVSGTSLGPAGGRAPGAGLGLGRARPHRSRGARGPPECTRRSGGASQRASVTRSRLPVLATVGPGPSSVHGGTELT